MVTPPSSQVWRLYETDGVPASGPHKVKKTEVVAWANSLEAAVASTTYTQTDRLSAAFITMVTNTPANVVGPVSFAAGRYLAWGNTVFSAQGTTNYTEIHTSLSLTSATVDSSPGSAFAMHLAWEVGQAAIVPTANKFFNFASATNVYLVAQVKNTGAAMLAYGSLCAIKLP